MRKLNYKHNSDYIFVSFTYLIAHGMILLNKGIFWDDWVFYLNVPNIETLTREIGNPGQSFFISLLLNSANGPIIGRFVTFFSFYFSMIFLYATLRKIDKLPPITRLFLVILFAVFPVNLARIAMVDVFYSVCYFLFFLGLWLVSIMLETHNPWIRILSLVVFYIAFFTNSILVFYALVILFIIYQNRSEIVSIKKGFRLVFGHLDYLILPILFWIIKTLYFIPTGHYADYNKLTLEGIKKAPALMKTTFNTSFVQILKASLKGMTFPYILIGLLLGILVIWLIRHQQAAFKKNLRWYGYLGFAVFGVLVFFMAVFPYNALGIKPSNYDWNSRHQLLIPLGAAMMICFGSEFILRMVDKKGRVSILILSFITLMFIRINVLGYFEYQRDWYKQQGMIASFENSTIIKDNTTFIIKDHFSAANAASRKYRFYEYSGYLRDIFGEETRFILPETSYVEAKSDIYAFKSFFDPYYNLSSYVPIEPEYTVAIKKGSINLHDRMTVFGLIYDEWTNEEKFNDERIRFVKMLVFEYE